jgi:hypothetical protein
MAVGYVINEGNDEVKTGGQGLIVSTQSLYDPGALLRYQLDTLPGGKENNKSDCKSKFCRSHKIPLSFRV